MVNILSQLDADAVTTAVTQAERATRGEIMVTLTRRSDDYAEIALALALSVGFAAAIVVHLFKPAFGAWIVLAIQAAAIALTLLLIDVSRLAPRLVPIAHRQARLRRLAHAQFVEAGLTDTPDRAAILLLVSLDERCVELVADRAIHDLVGQPAWDMITRELTLGIAQNGLVPALTRAVAMCGETLALHFPATGERENRHADRPREI